jgi:uncharacterized OB-fold protein
VAEQPQFTIEQFCKNISQGKILGGKCKKCGKIHFPPRPICDVCFSKEFEWTEIPNKGKVLTYTVIYVAPTQFQASAPYIVGIVQLDEGLKIPGMIKDVTPDKLKIGLPVSMVFEACGTSMQWPQWPRYYFKPV